MIPTKDRLDELAENYRNGLLDNAEEYVMECLLEAKAYEYSIATVTTTETVRAWMLREVGKRYEERGYKVIYHTQYSFPNCGIDIIIDDEKYEQEQKEFEERWISSHRIPCEKKWWEFWK